jgi:hypothetical protein
MDWGLPLLIMAGAWILIVVLALWATDRLFPRIRHSDHERARHDF